jgi:hypothetical protein
MSAAVRHEWECAGGAGGWELWRCLRCGREAFPGPFGFMWSDLARYLPFATRWRCIGTR